MQQVGMHFSMKILAMRSAYYVDDWCLGPASSLEELQTAFGRQFVILRWKSGIEPAKGPVLQHLPVLVSRLIFVRRSRQTDSAESDRNFSAGYFRWFAES
jgi:hypothetical protein